MKIVWQLLLWAVCKMSEHLSLQHGIQLVLNSVGHIQMCIVLQQNVTIIKLLGCSCSCSCYFEVLDKNSLHVLCCYVI